MNEMKRNVRVVISLMILITLVIAGCSSKDGGEGAHGDGATEPGNNTKEVKLYGYLLGDAPKGMPDVLAALNEKLKKDINATVELNYISWGDLASKYPLILASGQDVDFIFTADWNFYVPESNKGSFMELNPELIQKYMPRYYAKQDSAAYEAAKVNGKQYMIPTTTPDRKVAVMVLHKDIMTAAGVNQPSKLSDLEPYFAEIKKNHPNMTPLNLDSQYDLPAPFGALVSEKFAYGGAPMDTGDPSATGNYSDQEDPSGKILSITDEPVKSAFTYAAETMKRWYDAGYINKNPYANKIRSKDNFCEGKAGVAFGNSIDIQATLSTCSDKGIETYIFPVLSPSGHATTSSWLNNGVAIAANSKNVERTLQALDLIMEDESYAYTVYYGIEGKNYIIQNDKIALPDGVTTADNSYPPDSGGFWFVDKDFFKPSASWTDSYVELNQKIKDYLQPPTYLGFTFNSENVKTEIANLKNVSTQYYLPLTIGTVPDVNAAFVALVDKMKSAGVDRVKEELENQTQTFAAAKKSQ